MDSLTQITLGAATAELVAGKKLGNKAMIWGAIAGTLPDLDVLIIGFLDSVEALSFHRGVSHSLFWISVAAPVIAFLVYQFYKNREPQAGYGTWLSLIWIAMFTHPLIDALTTYGTQLFLPFSDMNFYYNCIFVADLFYTLPFLFFLIWASRKERLSTARRKIMYAGFAVSCSYLLFCMVNRSYVKNIFAESLQSQNIAFIEDRLITGPTPLNQILWYGVAETEEDFVLGIYSHLDKRKEINFRRVPKNHDLVGNWEGTEVMNKLSWFSDNYYQLYRSGDTIIVNDLRFGPTNGLEQDTLYWPFKFKAFREKGKVEVKTLAGPQFDEISMDETAFLLINRLKGRP